MARPEKVEAVTEIAGRFREASAALLTEYRGLTVTEIADVRDALRGAETDYKVLKNTLARIAAGEVGLDELGELLEGPTAIAFIRGDAVAAAKALDDASRKYPVLVVKGGVLNGKILDADRARALARVEPREVQLAKIAGMFNSPLQQTANVLSALLRNFGSMLAQVLEKKESGELPGAPSGEPAPETAAPPEAQVSEPAEADGDESDKAVDTPTEPDQAEVTDGPPSQDEATDDQSEPADK